MNWQIHLLLHAGTLLLAEFILRTSKEISLQESANILDADKQSTMYVIQLTMDGDEINFINKKTFKSILTPFFL
jgi:hypothetical protein